MAISNYSELVTAINNRTNRDDLGSFVDDFIALAEARLVRDLKTSELELTTTLAVDSQQETLPTDFAGMVRIHMGGTYPALDYIPPDTFHSIYAATSTGRPISYTIEGNNILFAPAPDEAYTATYTYYQKPDVATTLTNRLLTMYPDAYLFACLVEAYDHLVETEKVIYCEAKYGRIVDDINESNQYKGPLSMKMIGIP